MLYVDAENFESYVLKNSKPVIVDFYADWCGPCKAITPLIEEVDRKNTKYTFAKYDIEKDPSVATRYGVKSIPTLIVFHNGEPEAIVAGADRIKDFLQGLS